MLGKFLFRLIATVFIIMALLGIAFQTDYVQNWVAVELKYQIREKTGWKLSYAEFSWKFPFRFSMDGIILDDQKGTQIHIENASGIVNPLALLQQYIIVHDVEVTYNEWNLTGTIRANPKTNGLSALLTVTSLHDPSLIIQANTRTRNLMGQLELTGQWNGIEGSANGNIAWDGEKFLFDDISGLIEGFHLVGQVNVDRNLKLDGTHLEFDHTKASGEINLWGNYRSLISKFDIAIPRYERLSQVRLKGDIALHDEKISSELDASFSFKGDRYFANANGSWSPESFLQFTLNAKNSRDLSIEASLKNDAFLVEALNGDFFKKIRLIANRPSDPNADWNFFLEGHGAEFSGEMAGEAQVFSHSQALKVASLKGNWKDHRIVLQDPFTLTHVENEITLSPFFATMDEGTIYTTFDYIGNSIHIASRLIGIPVDILPFLEEGLPKDTTFDANCFIFGPLNKLGGQLQIEFPRVMLNDTSLSRLPALEGKITANLYDEKLDLNGSFTGLAATPITLDASLPITISLDPPQIEVKADKPFSTKLSYEGPVGPITELITSEVAPLKGNLKLEIDLSGTLANPMVSGTGHFRDGSYESIDTGVVYENISATFKGSGDHVQITSIHAESKNGGNIAGYGTLNISIDQKIPFDITLKLDNTRLVAIDWITSNGTGELHLTGNSEHAAIEGSLLANDLVVTIPENKSADVKVIPITYINQCDDEAPPTLIEESTFDWPIDLNISIETTNGVAKGDDFRSKWKGQVVIGGSVQDVQLQGKVTLIEGSYIFNGRPFEITQGAVAFAGDPLKGTNLYVIGEQDLGEITAEVLLKGTLDNPEISLRSKPALPQREVLSWILFGRGTSEINTIENQELTKSISELVKNHKQDVLTRLRRQIGIDRIDIHRDITGETNEMSVKVGKYISRGVLVSVNKNINNDANRIGIEARVTRNIKVEAEVGDNSEGHLFLKWKRDY